MNTVTVERQDGSRVELHVIDGAVDGLQEGDCIVLASGDKPVAQPLYDAEGNHMLVAVEADMMPNSDGPKIRYSITEKDGSKRTYYAPPEAARAVALRVLELLGEAI